MPKVIPTPIEVEAELTATATGSRHKINRCDGYYAEIDVSCDLKKAAGADVTVSLVENVLGNTLHERTVTLEAGVWTPVQLKGIVNRIDDAVELQVVVSASMANLNYKMMIQRRPQQGG